MFPKRHSTTSAPPNKMAARDQIENILKTSSPTELLAQIQTNFTQKFLMMLYTKVTQIILFCLKKCL